MPTLKATQLPTSLAPSLRQFPEDTKDEELLSRKPHVNQLLHPTTHDVLVLRSRILRTIREFLVLRGYTEVETPVLDMNAGGAIARPFETTSSELSKANLKLRIAPELWLKRLIIGGQERVFELGKVFRNEGEWV
jgi:lysyl-tRNA synthetase, class II